MQVEAQTINFESQMPLSPLVLKHGKTIESLFEARKGIIFPKKYLAALKMDCGDQLEKIYKKNKQLPLKDALLKVLKPVSSDISPEMLLQLTQHLVVEWKKIQSANA